MDKDYNVIQYAIPESSKVTFEISSHARNVILKPLNGISLLIVNNREISLPLQQEFPIPIWECLCPILKTKTASNFLVQGSHYATVSKQGEAEDALFQVFESGDSYSFVLGKDIQLKIYPIQYAKDDSKITIRSTRGTCEISGYKLSPKVVYPLTPFSPTIVKSYNDESYSVHVQGLDRKAMLSILDKDYEYHMKGVREHIIARCFSKKGIGRISQTILVLGPKNVGKTSFCHLLVSDALEKKFSPLYIDLNIQRNLALPGSVSLTQIGDRTDSNCLDFKYNVQRMLHFGSTVFHPGDLRYYYFLIRKLGWMIHRRYNNKDSIVIIDTTETKLENTIVIDRILKSFSIDLAVVIGDHDYYEKLEDSVLSRVPTEFIPKDDMIEPKSDYYDTNYNMYRIKEYFYGSTAKPSTPQLSIVRFDCFSIYKITIPGSGLRADNEKLCDCCTERIAYDPSIVDKLLAVSAAQSTDFLSLSEVKYYVCITNIDPSTSTATFMAPQPELFTGGILLMGQVLMFKK